MKERIRAKEGGREGEREMGRRGGGRWNSRGVSEVKQVIHCFRNSFSVEGGERESGRIQNKSAVIGTLGKSFRRRLWTDVDWSVSGEKRYCPALS